MSGSTTFGTLGDKDFYKPRMEALQFDSNKKTLSLIKTDLPAVTDKTDVIVKVVYSGICGTDLHIMDGSFPCRQRAVVLGHEFCGVASSVGSEVKHIKRGDRVVVDPNSGCGICSFCTDGRYHQCATGSINNTIGIFCDGGWAQFCKAPASQVYRIPDGITFKQAVLTEPLSCVCHGWDRISPVTIGSSILVTGAGIIGNLWSGLLHHAGHRNVTVVEPLASRRALNQLLGTGFKCCTPDDLKTLKASQPQWGVDLCVDCSGSGPAIQSSVELLKPGGTLCIFGVAAPDTRVSLSPFDIYKKELTIVGVLVNQFGFTKALGLIEAMGSRYLDYEKLGVKTYTLDKYQEAFTELKNGTISKAIFKVTTGPELNH